MFNTICYPVFKILCFSCTSTFKNCIEILEVTLFMVRNSLLMLEAVLELMNQTASFCPAIKYY